MRTFLIAGSSNVGKTTAARYLATRLGVAPWFVDDLARESRSPALAFERDPSVWRHPPEELCRLLIDKGRALWPTIEELIRSRVAEGEGEGILVDGEGPEPANVARLRQDLVLQAVFVVELDASMLTRTLESRSASFRALPPDQQQNVAWMNVRYGEWLMDQAERSGVPWIESQPWSTLPARVLNAWGAD